MKKTIARVTAVALIWLAAAVLVGGIHAPGVEAASSGSTYTVQVDHGYVTASPWDTLSPYNAFAGACTPVRTVNYNSTYTTRGYQCTGPGTIQFATPAVVPCGTAFTVTVDGVPILSDPFPTCPVVQPSVVVTRVGNTVTFTNPGSVVQKASYQWRTLSPVTFTVSGSVSITPFTEWTSGSRFKKVFTFAGYSMVATLQPGASASASTVVPVAALAVRAAVAATPSYYVNGVISGNTITYTNNLDVAANGMIPFFPTGGRQATFTVTPNALAFTYGEHVTYKYVKLLRRGGWTMVPAWVFDGFNVNVFVPAHSVVIVTAVVG
jgi:hypothetical protein